MRDALDGDRQVTLTPVRPQPPVSLFTKALFFLVLMGPPALRSRSATASLEGQLDMSSALNICVWTLAGAWVVWEIARYRFERREEPGFGLATWSGLVLSLLLLPSVFTSGSSVLSLYRVLQIAVGILFFALLAQRIGPRRLLSWMERAYWYLLLATAVFVVAAPSYVFVGSRLIGGTFVNAGFIGLAYLAIALGEPKAWRSVVGASGIVLSMAAVILSQQRTIYVALAVIVVVVLLRHQEGRARGLLVWLLGATSVAVVALGASAFIASWVIRDRASLATWSDRLPLWDFTLSMASAYSPLTGLGFGTIRTVTMAHNAYLGAGHSAYVEIIAGAGLFGLLGLGLLLFAIVVGLGRSLRRPDDFSMSVGALMIGCLIFGVTSSQMILGSEVMSAFLATLALLDRAARHRESTLHPALPGTTEEAVPRALSPSAGVREGAPPSGNDLDVSARPGVGES